MLRFICVLLLSLSSFALRAQVTDTIIPTHSGQEVNRLRAGAVAAASTGALAGVYIYMQNVWWHETPTKFKIDHVKDYRYAKNVDKAGHFVGGVVTSELFGSAFRWAGVSKPRSLIYGAAISTAIQGMIEIKDGFAPTYGYSFGDLGAGAVGSFLPLLQYHVPATNAVKIKLSYYRHNNYYFDGYPYANVIDDYMNQTYWLSVSVNDWLPKGSRAERIWPDFLTVTGGWGVDETLNGYYIDGYITRKNAEEYIGRGHYEYYISLDVDWRKIIKQNTHFKRAVTYTLNYIKLPLPALRLGPSVKGYWAFW
jgi:hypothetical protein